MRQRWVGAGSSKVWRLPDLPFEPEDGARRFEFGTRPYALFAALSQALAFIDALGFAAIQSHALALAAPLEAALRTVRGVTVETLDARELCAGLVSLFVSRLTEPDVGARLWRDHDIIVA